MPIRKKAPQGEEYVSDAQGAGDVFETEDPNEYSKNSASLQSGWGAAKRQLDKVKPSGGGGNYHFRFSEDQQLIAFIEGEPIDSFSQHWIKREGQMSFRCAEQDCPLCATGDNPSAKFTFFVLHFEVDGDSVEPTPKLMTVGIKALKQLLSIDEDPKRGGPLKGKFFSAYRTGKRQDVVYSFIPVKPRDLEEDWELPEGDAVAALKEHQDNTEPKVFIPSIDDLREVAREIKKSA
jgi:hypothetical protein